MNWHLLSKLAAHRSRADLAAKEITNTLLPFIFQWTPHSLNAEDAGPITAQNYKNLQIHLTFGEWKTLDASGYLKPGYKLDNGEMLNRHTLGIECDAPHPATKEQRSFWYHEVLQTVRHELEHYRQLVDEGQGINQDQRGIRGQYDNAPMSDRRWYWRDYYTCMQESEAYVSALMITAKKTRQPFTKLLDDFVKQKFSTLVARGMPRRGSETLMNDITKKYMRVAKRMYPKVEGTPSYFRAPPPEPPAPKQDGVPSKPQKIPTMPPKIKSPPMEQLQLFSTSKGIPKSAAEETPQEDDLGLDDVYKKPHQMSREEFDDTFAIHATKYPKFWQPDPSITPTIEVTKPGHPRFFNYPIVVVRSRYNRPFQWGPYASAINAKEAMLVTNDQAEAALYEKGYDAFMAQKHPKMLNGDDLGNRNPVTSQHKSAQSKAPLQKYPKTRLGHFVRSGPLNTITLYHSTSPEDAQAILQQGIKKEMNQSGMFRGLHLADQPGYFDIYDNNKKTASLAITLDPSKIIDANDITKDDILKVEPWALRSGPGYINHIKQQIAQQRGFVAIRNGHETVLFDPQGVLHMKIV